ncbi:MAG: hypothetical protein JWP97_5885 [Labilithrix sp.]|nr:hypothetical protein [Labilithrix sp.]
MSRSPQRPSSSGKAPRDLREEETRQSLAALRKVYGELEQALDGWGCDASTDCCRFGVTGREPYPTAIEQAELERGVKARGGLPRRRSLPVAGERRCALLGDDGKCLVYASRPFGCRTFFCERASGPAGSGARALPKQEIARLSRAVADLSARFAPADPGPRPMTRVTETWAPRGEKNERGSRR